MIRKDRAFAWLLLLLMLVPCTLAVVHLLRSPPGERDGPVFFLLTFGMLPATLGPLVHALLARGGRGLSLRAIRGGSQPVLEVRARSGAAGGLLLPLGGALSTQRVYRVGLKRLVVADASVSTAAGEVVFARGGTRLDPELLRWLEAVAAWEGRAEPTDDAADPEVIAAAAARDTLAAPPSIETSLAGGWPTWRYRSAAGFERELILSWMALLAAWLLVFPARGMLRAGALSAFVLPIEAVLAYLLLLSGPVTMELQVRAGMLLVRRKRFGLTLSVGVSEAAQAGIDVAALPTVSLTFGRRWRGATSPLAGGPDVAAMTWLCAAIRASAPGAK